MTSLKQYLTIKNWFIFQAAFAIVGGLLLVLDPSMLSEPVGMILHADGIHAFRESGALYFGLGIIYWFGRNDGPTDTHKGIVYGSFVVNIMFNIIVLYAIINELVNTSGLISFITGIIFTAGWGYVIFKERSNQSQV